MVSSHFQVSTADVSYGLDADCGTGSYLLSEIIDRPVKVIHMPVPYFNEKLLMSVERTLKRFRPDQPFERSSWSIVDDRNLFWRK